MKFRSATQALALAALFVVSTAVAKAQAGVYLNPVVTRITDSPANDTAFTFLGLNNTSGTFGGFDIGGYWDFWKQPGFEAGFDGRETIVRANNATLSTLSFGPRIAASNKFKWRPYGEAQFGLGRTKGVSSSIHVNKLEWNVFGGVDRRLSKVVDWRVIEVGYGSVPTIASNYNPIGLSVPPAKLLNISAGLVFRIGR